MNNNLDATGGNYCTTKAGLSAGTTTTYSTANTLQYAIGGKAITPKTAVTNGTTPTSDGTSGALFALRPVLPNQGSVFTFGFNAAGTLVVSQGDIKALDVNGNFIDAPQFATFPDGPAGATGFAYLIVKVGSTGSAWTFGTSNLSGPPTGVTFAFVDFMQMPARPQIA